MYRKTVIEIFSNVWPMLVIVVMIAITTRLAYVFLKKERRENFVLYKDLLMLSFMIYVICLFYVVTFQDVSWSTSNFIPFREMFRYEAFSFAFFKNIIGNMIMFLPYGFYVSYFLKLRSSKVMLFLSFIISITIETTQLIIGRVFDVDDILLNMIGGMLGFGVYNMLSMIESHLPNFLKKAWVYNIIIVVVFLLGAFLIAQILLQGE